MNLLLGVPPPDVTWSKEGKAVKDGGRFATSSAGEVYSLAISDATESDSGTYRATAVSAAGEVMMIILICNSLYIKRTFIQITACIKIWI